MNDAAQVVDQAVNATTEAVNKGFAQTQMMGENFRQAAEQSISQGQAFYSRFRAAGEETTASLETSFGAASKGFREWNTKLLDVMQANIDAQFAFAKAMTGVTSVSQAVALTTDHSRQQAETLSAQGRDFQELARKIATESAGPLKTMSRDFAKAA